jgi:polysaccharide pyruvyl transferase WcaK-like protein
MSAAKRVFQTGTFDVENYGDLLFPLIAEFRLEPLGIDVIPVSPTDFTTSWQDAHTPLAFRATASSAEKIDGVLVGGGNIIHANPTTLADYEAASVSTRAYAELWLGATMVAAMRNVPVIWNAPGVPEALPPTLGALGSTLALQAADYLSVRDEASVSFLGGDLSDLFVVPDTAAEVARLWPRASLSPDFGALLRRKEAATDTKFVVVHVKERSLDRDHASMSAAIEQFAAGRGLTPLLVAIGRCHGDHVTVRRIARHIRIPHILLDDPLGLREIAAAIAHAAAYVGASLHGYITSAAYDVPGVIVARPPLVKFSGFLAQIGRPQDMAEDWGEAFNIAAAQLGAPATQRIPNAVFEQLDAHWERVSAAILRPAQKMAARTRFLRRYVEYGMATLGDAWLLEPASRVRPRQGVRSAPTNAPSEA